MCVLQRFRKVDREGDSGSDGERPDAIEQFPERRGIDIVEDQEGVPAVYAGVEQLDNMRMAQPLRRVQLSPINGKVGSWSGQFDRDLPASQAVSGEPDFACAT
ncbi:hypothetical protein AYO38_04670 [bacterium SCGC AG-212-C10]|nr:hypothetical protein AYO38_04670 [bacterium SCGC AG-212-C10]